MMTDRSYLLIGHAAFRGKKNTTKQRKKEKKKTQCLLPNAVLKERNCNICVLIQLKILRRTLRTLGPLTA